VNGRSRSPLLCVFELLRKRGERRRLSLDPGNDVPNALENDPNGATSRAPPNMQRPGRAGQSDRSSISRSPADRPPSDSNLLTRAAHARFRQRSLHRPSGRGWRRRTAPRRCSVQGSHSRFARRSEPRRARCRLEPERARPEARATQAVVGSPAFARKGPTSTFMPLTARVSAKAPTGALAQASATAPKTPREARRITSNVDIGTSECVPGARRAESPRRLFTSLTPLRKTPRGGLLFPSGGEIFSVDLERKAVVEPDLTFRATMDLSNHRPSGRPRRLFAWERCKRWRRPGHSSFDVEWRNK
jgi:hypothetical protein